MVRGRPICSLLVPLCLTMLLASQAAAAPGEIDATRAEATPSYASGDLYLKGSRVYTHVFKTGLGHEHAVEGMVKAGSLRLGASQGAGQIVFDMSSYCADTDAARKYIGLDGATDAATQQQVNANMLGSAVLDVERFPTAVFKIDSAKRTSQASNRGLPIYQLAGEFTLHGVTRKLTVAADAEEKNGWTHLRGNFSINQTDYGMKPFSKAFGAVGVADQLTIYGDLWVAGTASVAERDRTSR